MAKLYVITGHTEQYKIYSAVETVTGNYLNIKQRGKTT